MRGKKTSDRKKQLIAEAKAINEEASHEQISKLTGVPRPTISKLLRDDDKFIEFISNKKKELKVEYTTLIQEHVDEMRRKMGRAQYRDIVGGFKIVHEKAFPEDSVNEKMGMAWKDGDKEMNVIVTRGE